MTGTVDNIREILGPGVRGHLSPVQANNLVLQLTIFAADPIDDDALRLLARFFTPQDYSDLIEERTIVSRCGYPSCANTLRDASGHIRNPLTRSIVAWQHYFCQLSCYQASDFFREQLSRESLVSRENVAWTPLGDMHYEQDILLLPEVKAIAKLQNKSVARAVADMIHSQKQLSDGLLALSVSDDSSTLSEAADGISSLAITEHDPPKPPSAAAEE